MWKAVWNILLLPPRFLILTIQCTFPSLAGPTAPDKYSDIRERLKWHFYRSSQSLLTMTSPTHRPSPSPAVPHLPHPRPGSGVSLWNPGRVQTAFNRAAVLSQGLLEELQDWDLVQILWEKNESWGFLQRGAVQRGFWCLHGQTPQKGRGLRRC